MSWNVGISEWRVKNHRKFTQFLIGTYLTKGAKLMAERPYRVRDSIHGLIELIEMIEGEEKKWDWRRDIVL